MWRLLVWLFTGDGHLHHWVVIKEIQVSKPSEQSRFTRYYLQCSVCGNIKTYSGDECGDEL